MFCIIYPLLNRVPFAQISWRECFTKLKILNLKFSKYSFKLVVTKKRRKAILRRAELRRVVEERRLEVERTEKEAYDANMKWKRDVRSQKEKVDHIRINTHTHTHTLAGTLTRTCTHTYTHAHKQKNTQTETHTHTKKHTHAHTYFHIHTQPLLPPKTTGVVAN